MDNFQSSFKEIGQVPWVQVMTSWELGSRYIEAISDSANLYIGVTQKNRNNVHVFDNKDFHFIKSILPKGHGPGELANISSFVTPIKGTNDFYLLANNHKFLRINIDSALTKDIYIPKKLHNFGKEAKLFGVSYYFINDTIAIVDIMEQTGNKGFKNHIGSFNLHTGETRPFKYNHPKGSKKRIFVVASAEHNVCAECYATRDLFTLYDLEGNFKCNVFGPDWTRDDKTHGKVYFHSACFVKDKLLAGYAGVKRSNDDYPRKILVYDVHGNYIKTLDFEGHHVQTFKYDEENNRLILVTDDHELAYLPLEGIL